VVETPIQRETETPTQPTQPTCAIQNNGLASGGAFFQPTRDLHATYTAAQEKPAIPRAPQPCPGCGKQTTWVIRGAEYVCYRDACGRAVPHV
jgi:hypothetical protein